MRYTVEGPKKRPPCNFSSWARVAGEDGHTVAYVPDETTAATIAELLSELEEEVEKGCI